MVSTAPVKKMNAAASRSVAMSHAALLSAVQRVDADEEDADASYLALYRTLDASTQEDLPRCFLELGLLLPLVNLLVAVDEEKAGDDDDDDDDDALARDGRCVDCAELLERCLAPLLQALDTHTLRRTKNLLRGLLKTLPRKDLQCAVARSLLEAAVRCTTQSARHRCVKLFLDLFDVTAARTSAVLRDVGGRLPSFEGVTFPDGGFIRFDSTNGDEGLSLAHWAVVLFPDTIKQMSITPEDDLETQTLRGFTALHYATLFNIDRASVAVLKSATCVRSIREARCGFHPVHYGLAHRNTEVASLFLASVDGEASTTDPTEAVSAVEDVVVPFSVDAYDLAISEWGRARKQEDAQPFNTRCRDSASSWQALVNAMETGPNREKVIEKFSFTIPLSRVLPSLAFFFLFLVFLMAGPLLFDSPRVDAVTDVVEGAVTSCLANYSSGQDMYKTLQGINSTNALGRPQWGCDLFLTDAVIQSTTLVGTEHWLEYETVAFRKFPQLANDTAVTARVPHALCFAFQVRYRASKGGRLWSYWVASQLYNQWPMAIPNASPSAEGTPVDFARSFRHRVIPAHFGKWMSGWEAMIWTALSLAVLASAYNTAQVIALIRSGFGPKRAVSEDDGAATQLLPSEGLSGIVWAVSTLAVELLVLSYSFAWVPAFIITVHERNGALAYADWDVSEKFVRASASVKLSTLLAAFPGLTFARRIPKPDHFHLTNSIAIAGGLIACAIMVEVGPVVRIEDIVSLVKPETIISMNTAGMAAVLGAFGSALFSRKKDEMSDTDRQWYFEQLEQRRYEATLDATAAVASAAVASPSPPARRRYWIAYRYWRAAQVTVVALGCLAQLALYAVVIFVIVSPTMIAAPYGASAKSDAITGIVSSLTTANEGGAS
jgi:hypothetical protein